MVVEGDDAPVEVLIPRLRNSCSINYLIEYLFAPDKPKSQSKEKNIVRKNIRILEEYLQEFQY